MNHFRSSLEDVIIFELYPQLSFFKIQTIYFYVYRYLYVNIYTMHLPDTHRGQKREVGSTRLEIPTVVSHHVGGGN